MSTLPPPPPPVRKPTAAPMWEAFAIPGIDVRLQRWTGATRPGVPVIDPDYVFREELVRELAWAVWPHDGGAWRPFLAVGPKGSGKTSLILQVAARCNIPVHRVNLNVGTTVRHLKGRVGAEEGATVFVPGVATRAMEEGGWLVLDEISGATPPVALSLFPILEPDGEVYLEDAQPTRYAARHADFRVFATDNVIGAEQEEGRFNYGGTNADMNEALLDRFGATVQIGYMDPLLEHAAVLAKVPGIDGDDLEGLIRVARNVRSQPDIGVAFSMRMVIDWARRIAAGRQLASGAIEKFAEDTAILDTAHPAFLVRMRSRSERDAVIEVIRRVFAMPAAS